MLWSRYFGVKETQRNTLDTTSLFFYRAVVAGIRGSKVKTKVGLSAEIHGPAFSPANFEDFWDLKGAFWSRTAIRRSLFN